MSGLDLSQKINLSKAEVLLVDGSAHSLEVLSQIVRGFGVATVHRCDSVDDAEKLAANRPVDLIVIDPSVDDGEGYALLMRTRRSGGPNAYTPIILVSGHTRAADVGRARDSGANFFVAKPVSANVLLQRLFWVARDKRPFVELTSGYVGPDRRFKFEGPPAGSDGRRGDDLSADIGDAKEANLSQDELSAMFKPQKIAL